MGHGCHECNTPNHCRCDQLKQEGRVVWTLLQALDLIRDLQPRLIKIHWNVGLGGSVLYKGESAKDLDLLFFPYDRSKARIYRLQDRLEDCGWTRTQTVGQMWAHWRETGVTDRKHVEVWKDSKGRRIDAITLGGIE